LRRPIVGFGLLALAMVQIAALVVRQPAPVIIQRGEAFPATVRTLSGSKSLLDGQGCVALVVCTTSCPYCATRATNRAQFEANAALDVVWVIIGSREAAAEFASVHHFGPNELGFVDPTDVGGFFFRGRNLRIPGTPLRVVVDKAGIVSSVALTHELPSARELTGVCN
jgi:hypothetical protein